MKAEDLSVAIRLDVRPFRRALTRMEMFALISEERARQDAKFGWEPDTGSTMPGPDEHRKVSVLLEEVGEVANALLEGDYENLERELVQVAAVCVAWLESRKEFGR